MGKNCPSTGADHTPTDPALKNLPKRPPYEPWELRNLAAVRRISK